ncbi:MAG: methyltransferase domain-containing protein [Acidimicrobiia bacterium]|nr:methyltransferase domain-containing protein [Acidimicrobiia bacterium]
MAHARPVPRPRNDPAQYDDLQEEWWRPGGAFVALHWLAAARAQLVPPPARAGAVLLDVACGGGLLAPHVAGLGYRHVGVDLGAGAVRVARDHGVEPARGDATRLPVASGAVDVVVAGEIFEHLADLEGALAEIARVLRPGGTLVCDTLADTWRCRLLLVTLAERLPIVPAGIHDPALFVDPGRLRRTCAAHGITLEVRGLRPSIPEALAWAVGRRDAVTMRPTRSTRVVYQGIGVKAAAWTTR